MRLGELSSERHAPENRNMELLPNATCSVYQEYYQSHQLRDNSPSSIAWIGSLQAFFQFAASTVGGPLFDRYGAKVRTSTIYIYRYLYHERHDEWANSITSRLYGLQLRLSCSP